MGVGWNPFGNSGAGAISLAAHAGAARVLLLGYDCQRSEGRTHWHGDHPQGLGNAGSLHKWPAQFANLRRAIPAVEVFNCSRATALTVFPLAELEDMLT